MFNVCYCYRSRTVLSPGKNQSPYITKGSFLFLLLFIVLQSLPNYYSYSFFLLVTISMVQLFLPFSLNLLGFLFY